MNKYVLDQKRKEQRLNKIMIRKKQTKNKRKKMIKRNKINDNDKV